MNDPVRAALESIVAYFDDAKQWTRSDQTYLSGVSPRIEQARAALASDAGSVGAACPRCGYQSRHPANEPDGKEGGA